MLRRSQPMNGAVANGPISDTPAVQQGWPTLGDAAAPHKKKSVPPPTPELLPAAEVGAARPSCPQLLDCMALQTGRMFMPATSLLAATNHCTAMLSLRANRRTSRLRWSQHHMMLQD